MIQLKCWMLNDSLHFLQFERAACIARYVFRSVDRVPGHTTCSEALDTLQAAFLCSQCKYEGRNQIGVSLYLFLWKARIRYSVVVMEQRTPFNLGICCDGMLSVAVSTGGFKFFVRVLSIMLAAPRHYPKHVDALCSRWPWQLGSLRGSGPNRFRYLRNLLWQLLFFFKISFKMQLQDDLRYLIVDDSSIQLALLLQVYGRTGFEHECVMFVSGHRVSLPK